jgi:hypothetical protein
MSQEPPRVTFPGPNSPTRNSVGQPAGRHPRGNSGRVVAFVLGTLFLLIFLCAGGLFLTYRRFNADSNFGGKFEDIREPLGSAIPDKTRDAIQRAVASNGDEAVEVADWLQNDFPEADKQRMVMEMQRSGLSDTAINFLTRTIFTLTLDEAMEPPDLGDRVVVLDFEWIVNDREARAVVAGFTSYNDDCNVSILYLNRQDEQWKLFDWRDVLQPMSEAQYWAIYAGLSEPQDEAHLNFSDSAYEIYCSTATTADKIKHTMAAYNSTKFPRRFSAMAQDTLCEWLVTYNAKQELAEIATQLSTTDFAGAWLYKARSAAWSNQIGLAFDHLNALSRQVGWHPKAGRLAAEIAETPEQKRMASEWLEREVLLAPVNLMVLDSYFKLADRQQLNSLFQKYATSNAPDTNALQLLETLSDLTEAQILYLVDIVEPIAELQETKRYLALKLAVVQEDSAKVLALAPQVLKSTELPDADGSLSQNGLWESYVQVAVKSNALRRAFDETPNRDKFLSKLRELTSYNDSSLPAADTITLLRSIPSDSALHDQTQIKIAIGRMEIKQGNPSEAFDSLFAVYQELKSQATDEEPMEYAYPLLSILGTASLKTDRWRELHGLLEPEELLLLLAWSDEISSDQLNQVIEWYDGLEEQPAYWSKYFRARAAYESGDWPTADRLLVEAIALAKVDERVPDSLFPPVVNLLLDFHETDGFDAYESNLASHWVDLRMSYAARCNALDRLVSEAQVADELDNTWVARLAKSYPLASIETQEKLASILKASPLAKAQSLGGEIRSGLLVARGQFGAAVDDQINRARESERGSYEQRRALMVAATQLLKSGDRGRTERLKQVSRGTDAEVYVDRVVATLDRDIPALCTAMKRLQASEWSYLKFVDTDVLKSLQGDPSLLKVLDAQPLELEVFRDSGEIYSMVLAEDPEKAVNALAAFLKSKGMNYDVLAATRFDQAIAALELSTMDGGFVLTFVPTTEQAFVRNALTASFSPQARCIVMCTFKGNGPGQYAARRIAARTQLNGLLGGFPSAVALHDSGSMSVFCGVGWQERFGQSLQTGIDLAHPKECVGLLSPNSEPVFMERDGQPFVVLGEARELIPIKLQQQPSPWLDERGVTLAPSILAPAVPADAVVKIER